METGGSRLSQREEDVTHDGGTANARGGDNVEDPVHILTKIFLSRAGRLEEGQITLTPHAQTHKQTHSSSYPVCLQVLRFFELDRVNFAGFVVRADL